VAAVSNRERIAWMVAGLALVVALVAGVWRIRGGSPTVPDMGNSGNVGSSGAASPLTQRASDISGMTPQQRFDRLWRRVLTAAENGDSNTVVQFAPMAIGAYSMLDSVSADARYHAAMLHLATGSFAPANALADTILSQAPGHLFGYIVRGESADREDRPEALTQSYRDFLSHFDAELRSGRSEYTEHRAILNDFRTRAKASLGK
jgi:hypothetical protein